MDQDDPATGLIATTLRDFTRDWLTLIQMDRFHLGVVDGIENHQPLPGDFPFTSTQISTVFRWVQIIPHPVSSEYYHSEERRHGYRVTLGCYTDGMGAFRWAISCGNYTLAEVNLKLDLSSPVDFTWFMSDHILSALTASVNLRRTVVLSINSQRFLDIFGRVFQILELRIDGEQNELVEVMAYRLASQIPNLPPT